MSHYMEVCEDHGTILGQCRCPDKNKTKRPKPCPGPPRCEELAPDVGFKFPETGVPSSRIIIIEPESHGQPRPYADHERIDIVTVRYYDWKGNLVHYREDYNTMMMQNALSAVGGDRYVQIGQRKSGSLDEYAQTFVESVEIAGPHQVRVVIKEPYID